MASTNSSGHVAFATLVTSQSYVPGALTLAHALKDGQTRAAVIVLVTANLPEAARSALAASFDRVVDVSEIRSRDSHNLLLLGRPDLFNTLTKVHVWSVTEFSKVVFLDADTLPLSNIDELFDFDELSAAPDCGWPDIFNSGVFVLKPSKETFDRLVNFASTQGSWDGGDQGLLNAFFSDWSVSHNRRLPFIYNVTPTATYTYLPAYAHFYSKIKIVHFAGFPKPWNSSADSTVIQSRGKEYADLVSRWWSVYQNVMSKLRSVPGAGGAYLESINGPAMHSSTSDNAKSCASSSTAPRFTPFSGASIRYSWPEHEFDPKLANSLKVLDSAYHGRPVRGINLANALSPEFSLEFLQQQQAVQAKALSSTSSSEGPSSSSAPIFMKPLNVPSPAMGIPGNFSGSSYSGAVKPVATRVSVSGPSAGSSRVVAPVCGPSVRDRVANVEIRSVAAPAAKVAGGSSNHTSQNTAIASAPRAPGKQKE